MMEYRRVRMKMVFSDTGWMETAKYWKGNWLFRVFQTHRIWPFRRTGP